MPKCGILGLIMNDAKGQKGSVLIIVLWILMIIAFLAGQYLVHNKNKAELALNAMERLKRQAAVESFFALYNSPGWNIVKAGHKTSDWIGLKLGSVKFFVRIDSEGSRININTAKDTIIRNKIKEIIEKNNALQDNTLKGNAADGNESDYDKQKTDSLTDAILDWRDPDNLVRLNGAEQDYYIDLKKPYLPANGPFKTMTELLMVKGVNRALFTGKLLQGWQDNDNSNEEDYQDKVFQNKRSGSKSPVNDISDNEKSQNKMLSLLNAFTVYPKSAKRIIVRIISGNGTVYSEVFIFNGNKKMEHIYNFYYGQQ